MTNAPGDTIRRVPITGIGVGTQIAVDNSDITSTFILPSASVPYDSLDPITQTKWQRIAGSGYNNDRLLGRIYKMGPASFEWFPNIVPLPGKPAGTKNKFTISVRVAPGSTNSSPAARYIIYEAGGVTDTVIVNQNGLGLSYGGEVTYADSGIVLTNGGAGFSFARGGQDSHGATAVFGYIRVENDTALVSKFYKDNSLINVARDSGYYVRADAVLFNEIKTPTGVKRIDTSIPLAYDLSQNYPNPFNPSTTIDFALPKISKVSVVIYDILGREVVRLIDGDLKQAGNYRVQWNSQNRFGNTVATGVYFYRLQAGGFVSTKKMLLLK